MHSPRRCKFFSGAVSPCVSGHGCIDPTKDSATNTLKPLPFALALSGAAHSARSFSVSFSLREFHGTAFFHSPLTLARLLIQTCAARETIQSPSSSP